MCFLYKNNWLQNKIDAIGHGLRKDNPVWFFVELAECKFCIDTWFYTFFAAIYSIYALDYTFLIWGVYSASISTHFRQ